MFGDTTVATITVLASFMSGLSLGALIFSKIIHKYKKPFQLYGLLEVGIVIFALVFPILIKVLSIIYVSFDHLLKFCLAFIVLLIPAFFMGGTWPVLSMLRLPAGKIYGLNTLGGAIGCLVAGFFLIPILGIKNATHVTIIINLFLIVALFWLHVRTKVPTIHHPPFTIQHSFLTILILSIYACNGFCALGLEVLWTRFLVFFVGGVTYSFTIMLTTFILGTALGSLLSYRWLDRLKNPVLVLALLEIGIGLTAILTPLEFTRLHYWDSLLALWLQQSWATIIIRKFIMAFLIMFLPALLLGAVFPLAVRINRSNYSMGLLYGLNAGACVPGAVITGFILIPVMGLQSSIILLSVLLIVMGLVLLFCSPVKPIKWGLTTIVLLSGIFYFYYQIPGFKFELHKKGQIIYLKEGFNATAAVRQLPRDPFSSKPAYRVVEVNGVNVAGSHPMLRTIQKLHGHLPILLYKANTLKNPHQVFILGLGTGEASYAATCHDIEQVDCLEIVGAEKGGVTYFKDINKNILDNPKFNLIIADARNYLLRTQKKYDIIANDAVHPEININTFSREYFALCREHLHPQGIFTTWIPLFNLSPRNLQILLKTFGTVFPHISLWYALNGTNMHAVLIGSVQPLKINRSALNQELNRPLVNASLKEINLHTPAALLNCFIADQSRLLNPNTLPLNTDDFTCLAYDIPRQNVRGLHTVPLNLEFLIRVLPKRFKLKKHLLKAIQYDYTGELEQEIKELHKALVILPGNVIIKNMLKSAYKHYGMKLEHTGNTEQAIAQYEEALKIDPDFVEILYDLGSLYSAKGKYDRAGQLFRQGLKIKPDCALIYNSRALWHLKIGRKKAGAADLHKAIQLDPDYADAYGNLGKFYYMDQRYTKAAKFLVQGLTLAPGHLDMRFLLAQVYVATRNFKAAQQELKQILKINPAFQPALKALKEFQQS